MPPRRSTACSNRRWRSPRPGVARIRFTLDERHFHAAGAAHGTSYFKMLDDAAFYAANSLVTDRFLLTTAFNLLLHPAAAGAGPVVAEGRWISGQRRVFVADARLIDADGEEVGARHRHLHALADRARRPARLPARERRLPTRLLVSALLRRANDAGGFGVVLRQGRRAGAARSWWSPPSGGDDARARARDRARRAHRR